MFSNPFWEQQRQDSWFYRQGKWLLLHCRALLEKKDSVADLFLFVTSGMELLGDLGWGISFLWLSSLLYNGGEKNHCTPSHFSSSSIEAPDSLGYTFSAAAVCSGMDVWLVSIMAHPVLNTCSKHGNMLLRVIPRSCFHLHKSSFPGEFLDWDYKSRNKWTGYA